MTNKLILGTVQMGLDYGVNNAAGKVTLENSLEILRHAHSNGISILDTAEAYGTAQEVIGAYHLQNPDSKFNIITKVPKVIDGGILQKVQDYLDVLKVDKLDTLMFHAFATFNNDPDALKSMLELKEKGLVEKIGISIYTNEEFEEVLNNQHFDVIQIPYNVFDNWSLRGILIEKAKDRGKIIHTRSAFLQGLFFKHHEDEHRVVKALQPELITLSEAAMNEGKSLSSVALNYCLQNKMIDNVLIGVDSLKQLEDNLAVVDQTLNASTLDIINNIKIKDLNLLNPSLWN